ncbi:MFS transporter [Acetobacter ghanensis]|uniref:MFS transporter n=1 Tax=Acetobacter ghanensis TaxID=431306 RepID=A0A0U5F5Z7_9PROT|nr:MFS transporter [Acetobacter ghanensis]GBQ50380.1 transporter [Acetobacter ghanensis DSM 18895]CEF55042.1 major facilitator transporter [Acetobacter ghanensis]
MSGYVTQPNTRIQFLPTATLILMGLVFGLVMGLGAPLFTLDLTDRGYGAGMVAANSMMHALGALAMAPFMPLLATRLGPRRAIFLALVGGSVTLLLFPLSSSIWPWFPLRILLGAFCEIILVLSESWLNQITDNHARGRVMGLYSTLLSVGIAIGPALLSVTGRQGNLPFWGTAAILLVAAAATLPPWMVTPPPAAPTQHKLLRYLWLAPIAITATLLIAMLDGAATSFLALYAIQSGWSERAATLLLSVMLLGATVMQVPIGWVGDRTNRRYLLIILALMACGGALLWPMAIRQPALAYPLLFVWDGAFASLYSVAMAAAGNRYRDGDLIAIYALCSLAWGIGSFTGPAISAAAMQASPHGLALFAATLCGLFALLPLLLKKSV